MAKGLSGINNMYNITADEDDEWLCPVCDQEGFKTNKFYGWCTRNGCIGVCVNHNIQDTSKSHVRKVDNLIIDHRNKQLHTYFTDGSGVELTRGIKTTAWAWVKTEWDSFEHELKYLTNMRHKSPALNSVQWCEAKAILDAIENTPDGETAHIHTDCKSIIQALRSMISNEAD